MKKVLKNIVYGALALILASFCLSCTNQLEQWVCGEKDDSYMQNSRAVFLNDTYKKFTSESNALTYNSNYDMYIVDGSKLSNTWYFYKLDLSKYDNKKISIDFITSMQVINKGSTANLNWVIKTDSTYTTLATKKYFQGASQWEALKASADMQLGKNSCLYLASYGLNPSNFTISVADTEVNVSFLSETNDYEYEESYNGKKELVLRSLDKGHYTSNIKLNSFTIYATEEKNVSIMNSNEIYNSFAFERIISLNGGGAFNKYRSIAFEASKGAEITVFAKAGGTGRFLALANEEGIESQKEIDTRLTSYSFTTKKSGIYNLFSTKNSITVYYVSVKENNSGTESGAGNESGTQGGNESGTQGGSSIVNPPVAGEKVVFLSGKEELMGAFICDPYYTTYDKATESYTMTYTNELVSSTALCKLDLSKYYGKLIDISISADLNCMGGGKGLDFGLCMEGRETVHDSFHVDTGVGKEKITYGLELNASNVKVNADSAYYIKNTNSEGRILRLFLKNVKVQITEKKTYNSSEENRYKSVLLLNDQVFKEDPESFYYDYGKNCYVGTFVKKAGIRSTEFTRIDLSSYAGKYINVSLAATFNVKCSRDFEVGWYLNDSEIPFYVTKISAPDSEKDVIENVKQGLVADSNSKIRLCTINTGGLANQFFVSDVKLATVIIE